MCSDLHAAVRHCLWLKQLLSSSSNLKNNPWRSRCCSVLLQHGFCGPTDRKEELFDGETPFVFSDHCSRLLKAWLSLSTVKLWDFFFPCYRACQISLYFLGVALEDEPTREAWGSTDVLWVNLQRNVGVSSWESSEQGKRTDVVAYGTQGQISMLLCFNL